MTISIGGDHAGYEYKAALIQLLEKKGHQVINRGCDTDQSVDYPDHAHLVARDVLGPKADLGVLLCGSGNGVAMTANKHEGIRAAICWNINLAELARLHNDANILVIPARFVSLTMAKRMMNKFLDSKFEGGRHQRRVEKINL